MEKFKTLKDHVYDYIATQIRAGVMIPGQKINENNIYKELNISRTPVREALIQLTTEGILENQSRKGFVIRTMSEKDIEEIYQVIGLLDSFAASLACDKLNERDYADMEFYVGAMDLAIKACNYEMYYKQQLKFHQLYIDKCGNDNLIEMLESVKNKLLKQNYNRNGDNDTQAILYQTNEEHKHILALFKNADKDALFHFILETHWKPDYALYDVID